MVAIAKQKTRKLRDEFSWFFAQCRAPAIRTMRRFAEECFIVPEGKYKDLLWRADRQPWAALWLDAIDSHQWIEHYLLGCVQGGKSLHGYVIPTCYHLYEIKETAVCGIPTLDVSADKWREEILPAILAREDFRALLPRKGPGSRGGTGNLNAVKFTHGPTLKFMSAGGGDEKKSSFTTRVVICTETDKMDTAGEQSRETDPISQIYARASSYDFHERVIYGECTVSVKQGFIWRKWLEGTQSRIACPCPHCGEYFTPELDDLKGYAECETSAEAMEKAYFECPLCKGRIGDAERKKMNLRGKLVHRGQTIDREGNIHGDPPQTHILGFRWNCFNNMFWSIPTIALKGWQVAHAAEIADELENDPETIRKEWLQFYWAMPYEPPQLDDSPLVPKYIAARKGEDSQFELPLDTEHITFATDIHKRWLYYLVLAFRADGRIHIPDYGRVSVPSDEMPEQKAVRHSLFELHDQLARGFIIPGKAERRLPDRGGIDTGYLTPIVFSFINEAEKKNELRYLGVKGFGSGTPAAPRSPYVAPKKVNQEVRLIGEGFHIARTPKFRTFRMDVDADYWKRRLQNCLTIPMDQPGAITIFAAMEKSRHYRLAQHFASERIVKGKWEVHGENHWLDCAAYALAVGSYLGFKFAPIDDRSPAAAETLPPTHWFAAARESMRTRRAEDVTA